MPQAAEYDHEDFLPQNQDAGDQTLLVKFYHRSIKDEKESSSEGRPIFKEREYVDIRIPGQQDNVIRPATERDKLRFPRHYAAFQQRMEMPVEGTPLIEWPAIDRSLADQLAFQNIKTVEQLADLNDHSMDGIMGAQSLKQKAKDWLEATKDDGVLSQLRDEIIERDGQNAVLTAQITELTERLDKLEPKKKEK